MIKIELMIKDIESATWNCRTSGGKDVWAFSDGVANYLFDPMIVKIDDEYFQFVPVQSRAEELGPNRQWWTPAGPLPVNWPLLQVYHPDDSTGAWLLLAMFDHDTYRTLTNDRLCPQPTELSYLTASLENCELCEKEAEALPGWFDVPPSTYQTLCTEILRQRRLIAVELGTPVLNGPLSHLVGP